MENICRTCLRTPQILFSMTDNIGLIYKIETISSVQLSDNVKLPSTICGECVTNVNKLFNFRKVIINSDKEIRERYASLQRFEYNGPKIKTDGTQSNDSATVKDDFKLELKEDNESMDDNGFDMDGATVEDGFKLKLKEDNESMDDNDIDSSEPHDSDTEVSRETSLMDSVRRAFATTKMYKCTSCDKTFPSRFKMYEHKRSEHTLYGICNICGASIRTDNLSRHIQIHSEGAVECKQCGKVFKNTESLRVHSLIHSGLTYTCETCGKISQSQPNHRAHIKTHENPDWRKVMCKICGKKVQCIKKHMNSHTGERPFLCSYCNKGFTTQYALKVHTRQHTNEKPYVCEYCPMAFPQKMSLTTHIKSKHKVEGTDCRTADSSAIKLKL